MQEGGIFHMEFNSSTIYFRVSLSLSLIATEILNSKSPMDAPQTFFSGRGGVPRKEAERAQGPGG